MKSLTVLAVLLLAGCSLTPRQKAVLAGVAATSLAISLTRDEPAERRVPGPTNPCANPEACR